MKSLMSKPDISPPQEHVLYEHKLKKETYDALFKFCDRFAKNYGYLNKSEKARELIKNIAEEVVQLEIGNLNNLLEYIEHLMKSPYGLKYFVVIHYLIGLSTHNLKKEFEYCYQKTQLGLNITVYDIFPSTAENKVGQE